MEDVLSKMDPIKKERLINSALIEFGNNSYKKASTNVIIKEAGISKGLLYHYFPKKEILYHFLIDFMFKKTTSGIINQIDLTSNDLLARIVAISKYKMQLFKEYPGIIAFAKEFYSGKSMDELKAYIENYAPGFYDDCYHKNIDYSLFKPEVDVAKALNITQWTLEKFSENYMKLWQNTGELMIDEMMNELYAYLNEFRKIFYKEVKYDKG